MKIPLNPAGAAPGLWRTARAAGDRGAATSGRPLAGMLGLTLLLGACAAPMAPPVAAPPATASTRAGPGGSTEAGGPGSSGAAAPTAPSAARAGTVATARVAAAAPSPAPETRAEAGSAGCGADLRAELLQRLNALRERGASCGGTAMPAAPALAWHPALARAALDHAQDMVRQRYFAHRDPLGRNVDARVSAAGYDWGFVAENIAAGQADLAATLAQWQASPGHCRNLLAADARDVGLACVRTVDASMPTRWVMVLAARPR